MYHSDRINYLLQRIQTRQASQAECDELLQQLDPSASAELIKQIGGYHQKLGELSSVSQPPYHRPEWQPILEGILRSDKMQAQSVVIPRRPYFSGKIAWLRYAVAIMLVLGIFIFWNNRNISNRAQSSLAEEKELDVDVNPGKEGAILTLADGKKIVLDSMGNGVIAAQNGSEIRLKNGQLSYAITGAIEMESVFNTIATPKGRQFQIILSDGSRVWLNAASSLRYPTTFQSKARVVEVTGEAYFEVAQNTRQPFLVQVGHKAVLQVLGTSFNVNAYENEAGIHTTLLEGSLRVIKDSAIINQAGTISPKKQAAIILNPRQQAQLIDNQLLLNKNADITKVMAWKNGTFNFDGAGLEEVMRQLERWYDIEVVYEKGIPDIHFVGELSREISLAGLLRTLKASKVQFRMEGARKLVVFH